MSTLKMNMSMNMDTMLGLAAAALGLVSLIAALAALRAAKSLKVQYRGADAALAALRRELELMTSIGVKTGRRVRRIEEECSGVAERVEQVEQRGEPRSFSQAIASARRGADSGKLAQQYGLSLGEADLVARLHGRKRA
jgi:hypothetical protein